MSDSSFGRDHSPHTPIRDLTPRRTPIPHRPYLNSVQFNIFNQQSPHQFSGTGGSPHIIQQARSDQSNESDVIYGTNISRTKVTQDIQRFIRQFTIEKGNVEQKIYLTQLSEIDLEIIHHTFDIDGTHLREWDSDLYHQLIYFPAEMITYFDEVVRNLYQLMYILSYSDLSQEQKMNKIMRRDKLMVTIKRISDIKIMRNISEESINRLIAFQGIVVRTSEINPEMKKASFLCTNNSCNAQVHVELQNLRVEEPKFCSSCRARQTLQIQHNLCSFTDKQFVKFQQLPEYVPEGETPHSVTVIAYDFNVDQVRPGDRIEVIGIFRAQPIRVNKKNSELQTQYKTYLDLISYRVVNQMKFCGVDDNQKVKFNDQEVNQFFVMAQNPNIVSQLVQSFAPSIHGNKDIKKGILAQLFGGTKKDFEKQGRNRFRSDINICLVGDPSTAKSQLLQQVHKIAQRGIYTSGRGSSAVGLTANVKKDPETRQFILQSGALVLSDLGICCIDQFDKMNEENKIILLEGMQQQTISIAKAGIVCQLNCRTAILAAANPIHSRYNPKKSVIQNINLPPALLSRFDLIYIMLDQPNEKYDAEIAIHILKLYSTNDPIKLKQQFKRKGFYQKQILIKYITYARTYVKPVLTEPAANRLVEAYSQMRRLGSSRKIITSTPRQLQSMIRLSQAFAKMRLSNQVQIFDVQQAIELITVAIQQAATDPQTGLIDMDVIVTGKSLATKQRLSNLVTKLRELINSNATKYKKSTYISSMQKQLRQPYSQNQIFDALKTLESQGLVAIFGQKGKYQFKLGIPTN